MVIAFISFLLFLQNQLWEGSITRLTNTGQKIRRALSPPRDSGDGSTSPPRASRGSPPSPRRPISPLVELSDDED